MPISNKYTVVSLYSGSKGNSTFIEYGGVRILIDAGGSSKNLVASLENIGVDPDTISGIFITHEHSDHISALKVFTKKHQIPVYIVLDSAMIFNGQRAEALCSCLCIKREPLYSVNIGCVTVSSFLTSHDSRASVGYKLSAPNMKPIAYATDTGYVTDGMRESMLSCESVVLESNHDITMLKTGFYPVDLKERILSKRGHLSNHDCADFISELYESGTRNFMLAHLSEDNNTPEIARTAALSALPEGYASVYVASQYTSVGFSVTDGDRTSVGEHLC